MTALCSSSWYTYIYTPSTSQLEAVLVLTPDIMSFPWRVVQEHFSNPSADKIHRAKQEIESVKQVMLTNIGT